MEYFSRATASCSSAGDGCSIWISSTNKYWKNDMSVWHWLAMAACSAVLTACGGAEEHRATEPGPVLIEVLFCDSQHYGGVRGTNASVLAVSESQFMPTPRGKVEITFKLRGKLVGKAWGDLRPQFGTRDEYRQPEVIAVASSDVSAPNRSAEVDECRVTGYENESGEPAPFRETSRIASNAALDALRAAGWKSGSEK
ncbi:hypothetical protein [Lysobacter sp. Root690]|uniref:hypothetical protein n=1 Tax=Lysobacter sp. Root690 TaxID=1736588 RepID=UPI000B279650|nr:hypothetical protein [Lysobacter sp. Root690]